MDRQSDGLSLRAATVLLALVVTSYVLIGVLVSAMGYGPLSGVLVFALLTLFGGSVTMLVRTIVWRVQEHRMSS